MIFGAFHFLMVAAAVGNRPAYLLAGAAAALIACWLWTDPVLLDMQIRHGIAVLGFAPAFFFGAALGGGYHYRSTAMEPGWAGLLRRSPARAKAGPAA
ncbi:MAG: hypothetical protein R3D02_08660 [Hyphomicrobiales bacterium]